MNTTNTDQKPRPLCTTLNDAVVWGGHALANQIEKDIEHVRELAAKGVSIELWMDDLTNELAALNLMARQLPMSSLPAQADRYEEQLRRLRESLAPKPAPKFAKILVQVPLDQLPPRGVYAVEEIRQMVAVAVRTDNKLGYFSGITVSLTH